MAAPNALILTPLLSTDLVQSGDTASTRYVMRITSGAVSENLDFPRTADSALTASRYYWMSGDGQEDLSTDGGRGDLVEMLQECLNQNTGGLTYTVTLDIANDRIAISASGGSFSIKWTHASTTLSNAVFGFANSDTATGSSVNGTLLPLGIWRPEACLSRDTRDWEPTVGGLAVAISGKLRASNMATPKAERDVGWTLLNQAKILDEYATSPDQTAFQSHWDDAIKKGRRLRLYDDETDVTDSTAAIVYRTRSLEKPIRRMGDAPPLIIFWEVDLRLVRAED